MPLYLLLLLASALCANELEALQHQSVKPNVLLIFYTRWCPPCADAIALGNEVAARYGDAFEVIGIDLDETDAPQTARPEFPVCTLSRHEAVIYGVDDRIPVLVVMQEGLLVKRYATLPEPSLFQALIKRTAEGFLANGTLPPEQRIDLWKQKRQ